MIIQTNAPPVTKSADFQQKDFTLKACPQAFKILADSLYSNKPMAVVRELICNAYDAQIESGSKKPIEIHCPNHIEPYFGVRDFGFSISHKFMMEGYTQAFNSTRNDSNKFQSGFGIGRLSALSLTDSYSIESITDKKRFYTVCFEGGLPSILFMGEEDTTEEKGLNVKVPIQDIYALERELFAFLEYKNLNIKILGSERTAKEAKFWMEGTSWRLLDPYTKRFNGPVAKMGIVYYPIRYETSCTYTPFELDFGIGELDITPSREHLSYSDNTIIRIKAKIDEVIAEAKKLAGDKLKDSKSLWEANLTYRELISGHFSFLSSYSGLIWNGIQLTGSINFKDLTGFQVQKRSKHWRRKRFDYQPFQSIEVGSDVTIIINDNPKYSQKRMESIVSNTVYSISLDTYNTHQKDIDDRLSGYGPIKRLSEIDYTPPPRAKRLGSKSGIKMFYERKYIPAHLDSNDESYHISCPFNEVRNFTHDICRIINELNILGLNEPEVHYIPPRELKKYPKSVEFIPHFNKVIQDEVAKRAAATIIEVYNSNDFGIISSLNNVMAHNTLREIVREANKSLDSRLTNLMDQYNLKPRESRSVDGKLKKLLTEKPLLRVINTYKIDHRTKPIVNEYLNT